MADHFKLILNANYVPGSTINASNGNSLTLEGNANPTVINGTNGTNGTNSTNGTNWNRKSKSPSPPHSGIGAYQNDGDV